MYDPFDWDHYSPGIPPGVPVWLVTVRNTKYKIIASTWGHAKMKAVDKYMDTHDTELSFGELVCYAKAKSIGSVS